MFLDWTKEHARLQPSDISLMLLLHKINGTNRGQHGLHHTKIAGVDLSKLYRRRDKPSAAHNRSICKTKAGSQNINCKSLPICIKWMDNSKEHQQRIKVNFSNKDHRPSCRNNKYLGFANADRCLQFYERDFTMDNSRGISIFSIPVFYYCGT